jgi:hypothetical protein
LAGKTLVDGLERWAVFAVQARAAVCTAGYTQDHLLNSEVTDSNPVKKDSVRQLRSGRAYCTITAPEDGVPQTIKELYNLHKATFDSFHAAIIKEWQSYLDLRVFEVISRSTVPTGKHILPSRSVFIKLDDNGNITKYKYRLNPKGFLQKQGRDYQSSSSRTGSMLALRALFLHVAHND